MNQRNIVVLIASMFLVSSGYTMVIPFLPLYLMDLGVPPEEIGIWSGLVFSICFLVAGIMSPFWGKLADSGGKKKMAIRASVLLGASYLFCGISQNEYQLFAARAFQGVANGYVAAAMTIISASADPKKIGVTLGFAQTALIVGGICGPLIGGVISHVAGMRNSFFISALLLWLVSVAVIFFITEPVTKNDRKDIVEKTSMAEDLKYAYHNVRLRDLLIVSFLIQSTILMIQPVTSLYVGELLGSMEKVEVVSGFIMSAGGIAGALTTALWGKFGQSHGYYFTMMVTMISAGMLTLIQAIPREIWGFAACQFLVGCFLVGVNPSLNAALVKYTPEFFHGRVFGLATAAQQFGNMAGPLIAACIMYTALWHVYAFAGTVQVIVGIMLYCKYVKKGELG